MEKERINLMLRGAKETIFPLDAVILKQVLSKKKQA